MAHGNVSDLVAIALFAIVVQWFGFPTTLFQDIGPLKAQFSTKSAEMDTAITFGGGLLLILGAMLSGVSWNPINGKMAGGAGFIAAVYIAYSSSAADSWVIVPRFFYIYAVVLMIGALHIFAFPSNALPEKTRETKNNHGNASDIIALALTATALLCFFYPQHLFQDFGPIKAQFNTPNPDLAAMIKFIACLMLIIALTFSGVKWNPINGKMAGIGGFIASGYTAFTIFKTDSGVFVPRIFYIHAVILFLGALHIFAFPSNPKLAKPNKKE